MAARSATHQDRNIPPHLPGAFAGAVGGEAVPYRYHRPRMLASTAGLARERTLPPGPETARTKRLGGTRVIADRGRMGNLHEPLGTRDSREVGAGVRPFIGMENGTPLVGRLLESAQQGAR